MGDKKKSSRPSKADLLIEEAVKAVEGLEAKSTGAQQTSHAEEAPPPSEELKDKDSGAIARIDLHQVVDKEAYLRLAADFENFRKRASKDREDAQKAGKERVLRGFLEILDNLDRGMGPALEQGGPLADGIRMIMSQIDTWLKSEGLSRIQSLGVAFDPNLHEAVSQVETTAVPPGHIVQEIRRGYLWSDRLMRAATVVVNKRGEGQSS